MGPWDSLRLIFCLQVLKKLSTSSSQRHFVRMKITDRTTRLLVIVLVFFLVAEIPMASAHFTKSRKQNAHVCRNLLKIARFSLSPSTLLQLFAHQPLNRQLGEQKNIADNFLSKQRFDLTQGVLGLLSALHMNTGGRQFFQVNQHLCALYQRQTPQNFFCRPWPYCRSATILLVT